MRCCRRKIHWDFLQRRLSSICGRYSGFVADHPYPFIIIPVLLSCVLSIGWLYKKDVTSAIYMFTPTDARSKTEQKQLLDTFPFREGEYVPGRSVVLSRECQVVVVAKDGGSILRQKQSEATNRLNRYITGQIAVEDNDRNYTYKDLCLNGRTGCYQNPQISLIPTLLRSGNAYLNMSYPTATFDGQKHYLASTLGGVTIDPVSRQITDAKAWLLIYQLNFNTPEQDRLSALWELEFEDRLLHKYSDPVVSFSIVHSKSLDRELARNGETLMPRFMIMFCLLVVFALLCTFTFIWRPLGGDSNQNRVPWRIDWVQSRPGVALAGVVGAGMGVASAVGFLCFVGLPYGALVKVMPFLIIAVRLDNTFLMIGALEITKRTLPPRERISHAMTDAAVSITITVLTDILSFACGVFTDFPSVQIFCVYTTVAIFITFVYQLTFLLGILALSARAEEKGRHGLLPCVKVRPVDDAASESHCVHLFCLGSINNGVPVYHTPPPSYHNKTSETTLPLPEYKWHFDNNNVPPTTQTPSEPSTASDHTSSTVDNAHEDNADQSFLHRWIRDVYSPFLLRKETKIGVLILLLIFWGSSIYGCSQVRQGLEPAKLLVDDSYAVTHYRRLEHYFWDYGMQMQLAFLNPGNVGDPNVRVKIMDVVRQFANSPHAIGMDGVQFWLIAFEEHLKRTENRKLDTLSELEFYDKLDYFLSINEHSDFLVDLAPPRKIPDDSNVTLISNSAETPITAFRLMIGMRAVSEALEQQEAADQFRKLADAYPEFQLVAFNMLWPFVDQYEEILPNVLQEIYSSVACMIAIALLLIPHPACAIWVTLAIASIDLGVIGYMTLWGLNMDTISMVTVIMSIGFSVDFTAHIAYAYVANSGERPDDRVRNALGTLAWPVMQGGISTLIGVIVLADLNSYMVVAFFKTVFLVIIFGLLHALVFLPVLLSVSSTSFPRRLLGWKSASSSSSVSTEVAANATVDDTKPSEGPFKRLLHFIYSRISQKSESKGVKEQRTGDPERLGTLETDQRRSFCNGDLSRTDLGPTAFTPGSSPVGSFQGPRDCELSEDNSSESLHETAENAGALPDSQSKE